MSKSRERCSTQKSASFETQPDVMWISLILLTLCCTSQAAGISCDLVLPECIKSDESMWTRCYEDQIATCRTPRSLGNCHQTGFCYKNVNVSEEAEVNLTHQHRVYISSSALQRGGGAEQEVRFVARVIDSTFFKQQQPPQTKARKVITLPQGVVLGGLVVFVRAGNHPINDLHQAIELNFKHDEKEKNGTCVFWQEIDMPNKTGYWSTVGCKTNVSKDEYICSCDHLSFFAVLVNPDVTVDKSNEKSLSYITYVGSGLSALFAFISLFIYISLHRRRPEKAIGVHMQLSVALFCLHLCFLLCSFWVYVPHESENSWVCRGLGLFLHWSLLATFTWLALEGFHLYLLLVRVFNIYVQRYLLKLSLVGWGLPTLVAMICGISGLYGKYVLEMRDSSNRTTTSEICWMRSDFQHMRSVLYVTVAFLCLVILYNSCMLVIVAVKLWGIRRGQGDYESSSNWKKMKKENGPVLWKDCVTVLGLSCLLGLSWGLASLTYATLLGIYMFTILNSLQGLSVFLWSVALSCKSRSENNSSVRDPSSQKMMTTSFNH